MEKRLELLLQENSPKCPRGSFSFWEKSSCSILWLPPCKEGLVLSHSPPLQLVWGLSWSGSHVAQLSTLLSQRPHLWSPWVYHFVLVPLIATSGNQVSHSVARPCLAGEGALNPALSQESCGRPCEGRTWGCSRPGPRVGPRDLFVLKQSPYLLFSQCPLYFLVSYLHKRWAAFGCSLCFSVEWVSVSPRWRGKLTLFPPISPPSSTF